MRVSFTVVLRLKLVMENHNHTHAMNRLAVIPTSDRLDLATDLSGKGVTIAFLDSGFYPHPDLTQPVSRIVAFHDVTEEQANLDPSRAPEDSAWHGTMTSVVAAGNGHLSNHMYRGLAHESNVVLIKVSENGAIHEANIEKGLRWVLQNKDAYNIRIVSISLGGDEEVSYKHNLVDQLAEEAIASGLVVIAASGNSGCMDRHHTVPPANSPGVITVGGYNDGNMLQNQAPHLYCSSYGQTLDGIVKPEILGPAMWIAAPVLPFTEKYHRAQTLTELYESPDYELPFLARRLYTDAGLPFELLSGDLSTLRAHLESLLRENKIISAHYQHVDGTSFAAPVVASLVALMLQANPRLGPEAIKSILISTAARIRHAPAIRQGYGMLNAQLAIAEAQKEEHVSHQDHLQPPRIEEQKLIFSYHDDAAETVEVTGAFEGWNSLHPFIRDSHGIWRAAVSLPKPGRYAYKFLINGKDWSEDPSNGMKEVDQYGGFNSILTVL